MGWEQCDARPLNYIFSKYQRVGDTFCKIGGALRVQFIKLNVDKSEITMGRSWYYTAASEYFSFTLN